MKVSKKFRFDASHKLTGTGTPCDRLHGHGWTLEVVIEGELDNKGMVMDFGELKKIVNEEIIEILDHRTILPENAVSFEGNSVKFENSYVLPRRDVAILPISSTTCENLLEWIRDVLLKSFPASGEKRGSPTLVFLRLFETPNSSAELEVV